MFLFGKKAKFGDICQQIVAGADDAVIVIDGAHDIVLFNAGAERIFGYEGKEALGEQIDMLLPEPLQVEALAAAPRGSARHTREALARRKNGDQFMACIEVIPISQGSEKFHAAIFRDISQDKKTEDELLRLASTDPLTGAYNRREFTAIAEREALRANRYNRPLSILMLDLDHFKRLNDTYGHGAGDKALQRFTTLCTSTLRNVDIFGRWGGEEFVALLPETDIEGASVIGERLRRLAGESVLTYNDHKINFTVSIGIAAFKSGETTIDPPLGRADSAVYDAKKAGRNRISVYRN